MEMKAEIDLHFGGKGWPKMSTQRVPFQIWSSQISSCGGGGGGEMGLGGRWICREGKKAGERFKPYGEIPSKLKGVIGF